MMLANPTWMKDLESKSKKMNLSLDSVMKSDAYYIYKHDDLGL